MKRVTPEEKPDFVLTEKGVLGAYLMARTGLCLSKMMEILDDKKFQALTLQWLIKEGLIKRGEG